MELLNFTSTHPSASYDPRWLGYANFPDVDESAPASRTTVEQIFRYYQETLFATPRALAYLDRFGIHDPELLLRWGVGFVDRTLGKQLPDGDTPDGARLRGRLQRLGLLVASGGEFFRGALVFPNVDARGQIGEAYGERITPKLRSGTPYHLYWSSAAAGFFNEDALAVHDDLLLCKDPLDALILNVAGYTNVVATLGARGFGARELDALADGRVRRVTTTFDSTPEGIRVSRLVAQALSAYDIDCYRVDWWADRSLKGYVLRHGPNALPARVQERQPCVQTYDTLREDGSW